MINDKGATRLRCKRLFVFDMDGTLLPQTTGLLAVASALDTVAFGDSGSDIPLFRALRYTLAVNGTEQIRRMSAASYQGNSLLAAYELALDMISADDGGALAQKATSA